MIAAPISCNSLLSDPTPSAKSLDGRADLRGRICEPLGKHRLIEAGAHPAAQAPQDLKLRLAERESFAPLAERTGSPPAIGRKAASTAHVMGPIEFRFNCCHR
jgi:hypothetical protein